MKPAAMEREELLDGVMNNYRRFYMRKKALFHYPWRGSGFPSPLSARMPQGVHAKAGFQRTFYDLGRVGYWGPQSKKKVDFKLRQVAAQGLAASAARRLGGRRRSAPDRKRAGEAPPVAGVEVRVIPRSKPSTAWRGLAPRDAGTV